MQPKTSSSAGWLLVILANLLIHLATALPPRASGLRAYRDESDDGGPVRDESVRHLDPIGGGHLLRDTWAIFGGRNARPTRGLDSLSGVTFGGARKRYDSLGGITFGNSKRNFDEIDRTGFNSFVKKNFDEIDRSGFDTFVKRNFDEIDRAGFGSFVKRSAPVPLPLMTQNAVN